jgi:hypothetical protein
MLLTRMGASSRYWLISAGSGVAWGLLGVVLARSAFGPIVWGGLLAAPLIGLVAGLVARPLLPAPLLGLALLALLNLQLAAALFGLGIGLYDWIARDIPNRNHGVVWQGVPAVLWGLNLGGYVLFLWPLAVANHAWLARWR